MREEKLSNGFPALMHPRYPSGQGEAPIAAASTMAGGGMPGSDFLFIGKDHHLSREEVVEFVNRLDRWVMTGHF